MPRTPLRFVLLALPMTPLLFAQSPVRPRPRPDQTEAIADPEPTDDRDPGRDAAARDTGQRETFTVHKVYYSPEVIPVIRVRRNFATVIQLPDNEEVVEIIAGDTDWWQIASSRNLVYVKPAKEGAETDLDVTGKSGTLYLFVLREVTPLNARTQIEPADMKVIVEAGNTLQQRLNTSPKYIPKTEADAQAASYQGQVADAEQRAAKAANDARIITSAARVQTKQALEQFRTSYPAQLQFDYEVALHTEPFLIDAIAHDERFTYIKLKARELPAVYEVKDGKPNLLQCDFAGNGTFVIPKIVDDGYITVGKAKLAFHRRPK